MFLSAAGSSFHTLAPWNSVLLSKLFLFDLISFKTGAVSHITLQIQFGILQIQAATLGY